MGKKAGIRLGLDIVMTGLMLFLMAYSLTGEESHEWVGIGIFLLFLFHHLLNGAWLRNLGRGRYSGQRILRTVTVGLLFLCMVGDAVSGVVLSRYAFQGLPIQGGQSWARIAHLLCSYWAFVLTGFHLGLHWGMISAVMEKVLGLKPSGLCRFILRGAGGAAAVYGIWALWHSEMLSYLFLRTQFVFFDFDRPLALFFLDYMAILILFVLVGWLAERNFGKHSGTKA